jgi:adenylate cyclase
LTDAEEYTSLAESMRPAELGAFMNEYYRAMFGVVERHGGDVADIAGDSMVAIWAAGKADPRCAREACRAATEILEALRCFNRDYGHRELRTRIGLDSGQVLLGNIGAAGRYEYRAVGDIVSTASRIQGLNRLLGTQVLVSENTLGSAAEGIVARDIGTFLLRGKSTPLTLYELVDVEKRFPGNRETPIAPFAAALREFRAAHWPEAARSFSKLLTEFPDDGPSRYYLGLCAEYRERPPADWRAVVAVAVK